MEIILSQNYFKFQNKIYQPEKEASKGTTISSTIAEIFLQHLEDIHIQCNLDLSFFKRMEKQNGECRKTINPGNYYTL